MIIGLVFLFLTSDENYRVLRSKPNKNNFHDFYLLSSLTRSRIPSKNIHAKGNENKERGIYTLQYNCTDIFWSESTHRKTIIISNFNQLLCVVQILELGTFLRHKKIRALKSPSGEIQYFSLTYFGQILWLFFLILEENDYSAVYSGGSSRLVDFC